MQCPRAAAVRTPVSTSTAACSWPDAAQPSNAVAPAAVRTPAFDVLPPERLEALRERIPVGRFGEPREVAELVAYLCSDAGGYVTGATLDVNGGLAMR